MAQVACDSAFESDDALGFLEHNFGKEAAFDMLLDYTPNNGEVSVGGRHGQLLFFDNSGRYAQVEFEDGAKQLVGVEEIVKVSQAMTTSFRDRVLAALQAQMGENPVDNLVVRFSEHWSQRVTGDFQSNGVAYSYEYTQSTGRVAINEMVTGGYYEPEVEGYTVKQATRFFSHTEQTELQHESLGQHARNFDRLVTEGSHYREEDIDDGETVDPSRIFS
jgi:hypothetical protein